MVTWWDVILHDNGRYLCISVQSNLVKISWTWTSWCRRLPLPPLLAALVTTTCPRRCHPKHKSTGTVPRQAQLPPLHQLQPVRLAFAATLVCLQDYLCYHCCRHWFIIVTEHGTFSWKCLQPNTLDVSQVSVKKGLVIAGWLSLKGSTPTVPLSTLKGEFPYLYIDVTNKHVLKCRN